MEIGRACQQTGRYEYFKHPMKCKFRRNKITTNLLRDKRENVYTPRQLMEISTMGPNTSNDII